jgi:thiol-disulfide isomerase/thioredoxin
MKLTSLTATVVLGCILCAFAFAANKENPEVSKLAHEGYWAKEDPEASKAAMAMLDKAAPDLPLSDWHGKEVTKDSIKGKIVLVDFWATWCGPCIRQIPHANEIAKKYADKDVIVFGACCARGAETMAKSAQENHMEYPTGKLTDATTESWNIAFWPTYAIIDREGKLRAIGVEPDYVEKILDELLKEQPAEKAK